jgi:hypothetical protein
MYSFVAQSLAESDEIAGSRATLPKQVKSLLQALFPRFRMNFFLEKSFVSDLTRTEIVVS